MAVVFEGIGLGSLGLFTIVFLAELGCTSCSREHRVKSKTLGGDSELLG